MATSRLGPKTRTRRARRERARGPQPAVEHGLGRVQRLAGNRAARALVAAAGPDVQRVIAANYQYMSTGGKPPRFDPRFAFKHLLNQDDSDTTWLANTNSLDSKGERVTAAMTNTSEAYAQAMNRFNTSGATAAFDTVLEPTADPPRPGKVVSEKGGTVRYYPFPVTRGWQFAGSPTTPPPPTTPSTRRSSPSSSRAPVRRSCRR